MIIWRARTSAGATLVLERGAGVFWVIDETGKVRRHDPRTSSVDDDLYEVTIALRDGQLIEHTFIQGPYVSTPHTDVVLASNLVIDQEQSTLEYVKTVLADENISEEERRAKQKREGDARIASIADAEEDFRSLGPDFVRAQHALIAQIRAYRDDLPITLLKTLVDLAHAHPAKKSALTCYVRACLLACFANDVPELVTVKDDELITQPPLADALAVCARKLDETAEYKEYVDATQTAAQYWRAAKAVRAAIKVEAIKVETER